MTHTLKGTRLLQKQQTQNPKQNRMTTTNIPENSEDELEDDSEIEKLLNNPENDTAMD